MTTDTLIALWGWEGDHGFIAGCLSGEFGPQAQTFAEQAIDPDADSHDDREIATAIIRAALAA